MLPMSTAPKDRDIIVRTWFGDVRVHFVDCGWLREQEPDVADCWRPVGGNGLDDDDIELADALGWMPA